MIIPTTTNIGQENEEILPEAFSAFHYLCKKDTQYWRVGEWHWHEAFVINVLVRGEIIFETPQERVHMHAGEAVFVNARVVHRMLRPTDSEDYELYSHLFDTEHLSGQMATMLAEKYVRPISTDRALQTVLLKPDSARDSAVLQLVAELVPLAEKEPFGYEFEIRDRLCRIWLQLLEMTRDARQDISRQSITDMERMRAMLSFIHKNYGQNMKLEDIAAAANISARECSRCFARSVHTSAMQYLADYRVRMAARYLLGTNESIMNVAERCGFSSPTYFVRMFKSIMHCTPREYRKGNELP